MDSETTDQPVAGQCMWQLVFLEIFKRHKNKFLEDSVWAVKRLTSLWLVELLAHDKTCDSLTGVFRRAGVFRRDKNIVSGGWCMDSKDTNQPVAGRAACGS